MPAEGDFFAGVGQQDLGDDFQLAAGAGIDLVLIEFEIEGEGVAAMRVFDERGVVNVAAGHPLGVVGEELVEIDFRDDPVGGAGGWRRVRANWATWRSIRGLDVGEVADGSAR